MSFVTKEQIDQFHLKFKDKRIVAFSELLTAFQDVFNYPLPAKTLLEVENKKFTKALFMHPQVIKDLEEASKSTDYLEDEEEFIKVINEARNGK